MGKNTKISYEEKLQACEDYLNGRATARELAQKFNLGKHGTRIVTEWVRRFKTMGPESLQPKKQGFYSSDLKMQVVKAYLAGTHSAYELCARYNVHSPDVVRKWIFKYNNHEELRSYLPKREDYTRMARKNVSKEEKIEIVKYCIEHDKDYNSTSRIYDVSYQQVYSWVQKYLKKGEDGLIDLRGKDKEESQLTELEKSERRAKNYKAKYEEIKMKYDLLKKVMEIERRRSSHWSETK